jgi:ribosome-binding factor A
MSYRLEQVNEQLRKELAILIAREIPLEAGMITVIFVKCSPDFRYAKIGISVLPEHLTGTALRNLKSNSSRFSHNLKKRLDFKFIPKFNWVIDSQERYAAEMDKVFQELEKEEAQ